MSFSKLSSDVRFHILGEYLTPLDVVSFGLTSKENCQSMVKTLTRAGRRMGLIQGKGEVTLQELSLKVDKLYRAIQRSWMGSPDYQKNPFYLRFSRIPSSLRCCYRAVPSILVDRASPMFPYRRLVVKALAERSECFMQPREKEGTDLVEEMAATGRVKPNEYALDWAIRRENLRLVECLLKMTPPDDWHRHLAQQIKTGAIQKAVVEASPLAGAEKRNREEEISFALRYEKLLAGGRVEKERRKAMVEEWPLSFRGILRVEPSKAFRELGRRVIDLNTANALIRSGFCFDSRQVSRWELQYQSDRVFSLVLAQNDEWGKGLLNSAVRSIKDPKKIREVIRSQVVIDQEILRIAMSSHAPREVVEVLLEAGAKPRNISEAIYVGDRDFIRKEVERIVNSQKGDEADEEKRRKNRKFLWIHVSERPTLSALEILSAAWLPIEEKKNHILRLLDVAQPGFVGFRELHAAFKRGDAAIFHAFLSKFKIPKSGERKIRLVYTIIHLGDVDFLEVCLRAMNLKLSKSRWYMNSSSPHNYLVAAIRSKNDAMVEFVIKAGAVPCKCSALNCRNTLTIAEESGNQSIMQRIKHLVEAV